MQNFGDISYLDSKKIIDIRSEVLFREAEDDFYYFSNINSALKKLKKAKKIKRVGTDKLGYWEVVKNKKS